MQGCMKMLALFFNSLCFGTDARVEILLWLASALSPVGDSKQYFNTSHIQKMGNFPQRFPALSKDLTRIPRSRPFYMSVCRM